MADVLSHKRFQDEQEAYKWVEAHLWPDGPVCPRCGQLDRIHQAQGKSTRIGVYKCKDCRKPFTVKVGTIFEDSHIPMRMWLQAIALLCASKKGISSNQLHRMLGVTLKSAWFMSHRIREAMRTGGLVPPMGGAGGVVEIDETIYGRAATHPKGRGPHGQQDHQFRPQERHPVAGGARRKRSQLPRRWQHRQSGDPHRRARTSLARRRS